MTHPARNRFDAAFKSWAQRPPSTAPSAAARRVMARLPERRRTPLLLTGHLRLASAAIGLAVLLAVGWLTLPGASGPMTARAEVGLPPLPEDVVLLWLDEETPLYLTVAPPATKGGLR